VRASLALSFISLEKNMAKLTKLTKVNENISINRYDNGWMVEIGGRDKKEDWKTTKTLCNTEEELIALIKEYNAMDLDN
jgi:hypothetical protein